MKAKYDPSGQRTLGKCVSNGRKVEEMEEKKVERRE